MKNLFITDVDGVLLDMSTAIQQWFGSQYGISIRPNEKWDIGEDYGVSPQVIEEFWATIWDIPFEPFAGAYTLLNNMPEGWEVVGLSKRNEGKPTEALQRDMERTRLDTFLREIVTVPTKAPKGPFVKALGEGYERVVFLDDNYSNLASAAHHRPGTELLLFDAPHNQSLDLDPIYRRVVTHDSVLREVLNGR